VRGEGVRWGLCAALVAAAHGCAFVALSMPRVDVESDAGSPIVTLDLSPIPTAPAPPPDDAQPQADAPPDAQAAPETPAVQAAPPAAPDPVPTPPVTQSAGKPEPTWPVAQAAPTLDPSPDPKPPAPPEQVSPQADNGPDPLPPAITATSDAAFPPPPPPPPPRETEPPIAAETPAPPPPPLPERETPIAAQTPPSAPPPPPPSAPSVEAAATAEVAAALVLSAGREEAISSAALQSWRRDLIAQIERHKRFPAGAQGQSGVASVAFSIDRTGRLMDVRISTSSGSAALDEAALDLIRRSQPFPTPPEALPERDLSFVAPVRYLRPDRGR
jgi:periplasmic protein TonB